MWITVEMAKLPHILMTLILVLTPLTEGKAISSQSESKSTVNESAGSAEANNAIGLDNDASEEAGHNNLLSDLARISKDEESNNAGNRQTIVGTEVSAATVKNSNANSDSNENIGAADSSTRAMVSNTPAYTEAPTYFTPPSPASGGTESTTTNNDMSLVRLSQPTHIVLSKNKNEENPFSKLITSNENTPEEEKSNDAVKKPQELSPLISERTDNTAVDVNNVNQESAFSEPAVADAAAAPDESKQLKDKDSSETNSELSSAKLNSDAVKSEQHSKKVEKGAKDEVTDHVVVCAGEKQTITCPGVGTLNIANADYGYDSNSGCPGSPDSPPCQANGVYPVVKSACQGQASCLLQSDGQEFGGMCPGKDNFLKVGYFCQNDDSPSSSPPLSSPPPPATSFQPPSSSYTYQSSPYISPYIPHPVSTQPTYYNGFNQAGTNSYNTGYMNDNYLGKTNYPYYGTYGNQGYYNYYNQPIQKHPFQRGGGQDRSFQSMSRQRPAQTNYGYKPWLSARKPVKRPAARPYPPKNRFQYSQYRDSNRNPQRNYNNYYNNLNGNYNTRNNYYDTRYYNQVNSPSGQSNTGLQYPRNSYLGSCYACQNCQECSERAYCQGCPKCKQLSCSKKPPKEEKYLDPIDSLVEEFGKKTKGMTPMEMSAVVISPAPKISGIVHSFPLRAPPKPLEEDDDDSDDDSDENEFSLSEDESKNREIENHESSLSQKKTSVSSSSSSDHSTKSKKSKLKAEKGEKRNKIYHQKHKVRKMYDDDDDDDGYDLKVYKNLLKKTKPKKHKIHRHKHANHSKRKKSKRRRLNKRWYDENENLTEFTGEREFDMDQGDDRPVEKSYYDSGMVW
ncbi:uncharacterized protein LOC114518651 [Dendronephthya gigantea]|uniref:uncharacterized protein LOC114518651 n=1 Tax=Dendronephthya gigantea TaxID=151771 RepID=UPI00106B0F52|nr:uncharacterized protein LOC114518651 [Dendronephthya gigantea]